ncbi:MAG: glycosyltransferase [Pirellulaceae bacterium]|nr:glycosyltransferase [Pirellulaceae bacterium]
MIQQQLQVADNSSLCDVPLEACEACCGSSPAARSFINGVFPSLLNRACSEYLEDAGREQAGARRAQQLRDITEAAIVDELSVTRVRVPACDVFVRCLDDSAMTRRAIASVLEQQTITINVHLILCHAAARPLREAYEEVWNVQIHELDTLGGFFRAVHELAPRACSDFIAMQDGTAVSFPNRMTNAVSELERTGGDFVGSPMLAAGGEVGASEVSDCFDATIPWPTLVFRRNTFIDLGGFADRNGDQDVELLYRAKRLDRSIQILPIASVQYHGDWQPPCVGEVPEYEERFHSLRHHAIDYPRSDVCCDVVLPVFKQVKFAQAAIESVIEQEGSESIVHLIDDSSPEETHELFRYWGSHRRVRLYRNTENIGQYASFNNASEFFETDLVAVQDSDDISLPHRLSTSGNLLRLCDADFFGGTIERFGDESLIQRDFGDDRIRKSFHAHGNFATYFVMNPTACFRVSMFRRLGGYTDFGGRKYKAGLDSEFMSRAYYSGERFAISSEIVTQYRVHDQAATRNKDTGFGTQRRKVARDECFRRQKFYQRNEFDPKVFGAITRNRGITQRVT